MINTNTTKAFQERLEDLIKESGKTLQTIAQNAGIKSKASLTKYQNDEAEAGINNLVRLANYFNVSCDYLLGLTDNKVRLKTKKEISERRTADYTGLNSAALHELNRIKEDLSLISVLDFIIENPSVFNLLANYFLSADDDSEKSKHFYYDILEKIPIMKKNYKKYIADRHISRDIELIFDLKQPHAKAVLECSYFSLFYEHIAIENKIDDPDFENFPEVVSWFHNKIEPYIQPDEDPSSKKIRDDLEAAYNTTQGKIIIDSLSKEIYQEKVEKVAEQAEIINKLLGEYVGEVEHLGRCELNTFDAEN